MDFFLDIIDFMLEWEQEARNREDTGLGVGCSVGSRG